MLDKITILLVLMCTALCGCSKDPVFKVEGTLRGGETMNLRAVYYNEQGEMQTAIFPSDKGKFFIKGQTGRGTMVEILSGDYRPLGRFWAEPGDKIELTLDVKNPANITAKGNDVSERWSTFLRDNARVMGALDPQAKNALVAKYVRQNPDDLVSTLLVLTSYDHSVDPEGGRALLEKISPKAQPDYLVQALSANLARITGGQAAQTLVAFPYLNTADSLDTYNPRHHRHTVLVFTDDASGRPDSLSQALQRLQRGRTARQLAILDFSLCTDTMTWHRQLRQDTTVVPRALSQQSARCALPAATESTVWRHAWAPGSVAAPALGRMALPRLPFIIVADSTGHQLYRGQSITQALKHLPSTPPSKP